MNEEEHKSSGPPEASGADDIIEEEMRQTEEREDKRWGSASQFSDWMLLIAFAILQATWMIIVILLEPGIR